MAGETSRLERFFPELDIVPNDDHRVADEADNVAAPRVHDRDKPAARRADRTERNGTKRCQEGGGYSSSGVYFTRPHVRALIIRAAVRAQL